MGTLGNTEVHNHNHEGNNDRDDYLHGVNFSIQRGFGTKIKAALKETLFPDDPFRQFKNEEKPMRRVLKGVQYFIPIFEWLPTYNWRLFCSDLIAGLTISSLAIPQGISYAKLASLPPLIGLCKNLFFKSFSSLIHSFFQSLTCVNHYLLLICVWQHLMQYYLSNTTMIVLILYLIQFYPKHC